MPQLTEKQRKEMGFPFQGFPTKHNTETWEEWEARCKAMQFDMSKLKDAIPVDGEKGVYKDPKVRKISDEMASLDQHVIDVLKPSSQIAPIDYEEKYRSWGIDFDDIR